MTKVKCGKCIACTYYNGLNGSGYQPCHNPQRPVPPDVERPAIKWDDHEDHGVGLSVLHIKINILCWCISFLTVVVIYGIFFK